MKTIEHMPSPHPEPTRHPTARKRELVVQDVGEETLVYDLSRHKAHCLNRSAKLLWYNCDGQRSVEEIRAVLTMEIEGSIDESWVLYGIAQLEKADLLEARITTRAEGTLTRREMAKRVGWAALVAVPVVSSILAPTVQAASSCLAAGAACTTSVQCCTGVCNVNVCL